LKEKLGEEADKKGSDNKIKRGLLKMGRQFLC
jgi:hypothetical protein